MHEEVAADVIFKDFSGQAADFTDCEIQGMIRNAADRNRRFAGFMIFREEYILHGHQQVQVGQTKVQRPHLMQRLSYSSQTWDLAIAEERFSGICTLILFSVT